MAYTTYEIIDRYGTVWMQKSMEDTLIQVASYLISTNDPRSFDVLECEQVSMDRSIVRKRTNLVDFCDQHYIEPVPIVSANPRKHL